MKLCRFSGRDGQWRLGRIDGVRVVSLAAAGVEDSMRSLLTRFSGRLFELAAIDGPASRLDEVRLGAPIIDPQKFLAIGLNYQAHADEAIAAGRSIPSSQMWFNKQVSCIAGPFDPIMFPRVSDQLDYEGELAYVIGTRCHRVATSDALSMVAGYMICNDVSVRDWQARSPTHTLGKSFDTHGPIGPWLTTSEDVADPHDLFLSLSVNGERRQASSTGDMIYGIAEQIAYLSTVMTLEPGDIIATGTPSGVGVATQRFLKPGDIVRTEIAGLGHIENRIDRD
jgi:2-keto-4-pentenoate hydratase/2-oxohepta-3-ene-1,7-dioic acid hydratase in catechol pathway